MSAVVDWSAFDQFPESTCHCRCGTVFRSHAKVVVHGDGLVTLTRRPCPGCGASHACRWIEGDPELL